MWVAIVIILALAALLVYFNWPRKTPTERESKRSVDRVRKRDSKRAMFRDGFK